MPSSMIFVSLVVLWLLILVPAVARHRQEVARPTVAALSGRVLERPRQQRGREPEVDVMDEVDQPRQVATRTDRDVRVPTARAEVRWPDGSRPDGPAGVDSADPAHDEWADDPAGDPVDEDQRLERPPPRYRPGRGGFDPQAAELTARARYAFRQRVVLALLVTALITGVIAGAAVPELWLPHAGVDLCLVGYLGYLRRQVRLEESIRERRATRMAGTRGRDATRRPTGERGTEQYGADGYDDEYEADEFGTGEFGADDGYEADDLVEEQPERVRGVGEPLRSAPAEDGAEPADPIEGEPALPRLKPAPAPALPAGTALVEADEDDPDLYDLDGPARPDYRRAAGE